MADYSPELHSRICKCRPIGMNLAIKTVGKNGENFGRRFLTCQKTKNKGGCGYFEWLDEKPIEGNHIADIPVMEPPTKKFKPNNENSNTPPPQNETCTPLSKSYREMALELMYQRMSQTEQDLSKDRNLSLQIAQILKEATDSLVVISKEMSKLLAEPERKP